MARDSGRRKNLFFGLSFAAFAAASAVSGAAIAQEAAGVEAETDEIVVRGFRGSLAEAIDIKRDSVVAIDAIVVEDIANFPDLNLSESVQRIPGVAITRDAGEGRQVTVRGLGPQFTRVRINGMEALSTVGGTDAAGGTNRDRGFDFNVFASDLFNSIMVRKTASAETEEGSLGATVDLRTARPFDYEGFTAAFSGQVGYNDLSESRDPRLSMLISNRTDDGRFGALFSIAYARRSQIEEGASTVRWARGGAPSACVTGAGPDFGLGSACFGNVLGQTEDTDVSLRGDFDAVNGAFRPRIPRYDIYEHEQERLGATVSLQFRPTQDSQLNFDLLYSRFDATRAEHFLEVPVFSTTGANGINAVDVLDYEIDGNTLVYGLFDDVDVRSESRFDELSTEFVQTTLDGRFDLTDRLTLRGLVGYARSDHDNPVQTTLLFDRNNIDGFSYDYRPNNRLPIIDYGNFDVETDVTGINTGWQLSQIRLRPQTALNTYATAYGDLEYEAADWLTLRGGVSWRRYEFETTEQRRNPLAPGSGCPNTSTAASNAEGCLPAGYAAIPIADYSRLISISGSGLDIPPGNTNTWRIPDYHAAVAALQLYTNPALGLSFLPSLANNREVSEENMGAYVQADWDVELLGRPLRGNIGVRYVQTDQNSVGSLFVPPIPLPPAAPTTPASVQLFDVDHSYDDWLPSLNVVYEPIDDFLIRFAASRVMSRPGLGSLSPAPSISVSGNNRTIAVGNPELDPFRATAYDLSFEWYFHDEALLSVAFFYKDIESFVTTLRETLPNFQANPLSLPDSYGIAACGTVAGCNVGATTTWNFDQAQNTPGGTVQGFEIGLQLPFYFLPGILSNFGFAGNYTQVESEITYLNSSGAVTAVADLQGLSRESWNATLYYEDDRFGARVSVAHRSSYLTNIPGRDGNDTEETNGTTNVDASASYAINDNFRLTFEALNLTDEVNDQYLTPDDRLSFYHHYGRQYFLGFRYTY
ncbi:MAG: TonB-dependent receptor [Hyphomonadaceae bacterium]